MNPDVKKEWLAALRNPDAKQIKGQLARGDGRCCLGVLCDLGVKHGIIKPPRMVDGLMTYEGEDFRLPRKIMDWAKLPSQNPRAPKKCLTHLNDFDSKTFAEIADIIERLF